MRRSLLTVLAILAIALAACRAPAGGGNSDAAAPSEAPAESSAPVMSDDPYDY